MATETRDLIFVSSSEEYKDYFPDFKGLLGSDDIFKICKESISSIESLVHLTDKTNPILRDGVIYSSAGGLLGGVYTVPINNGAMHKLGFFISEQESLLIAGRKINQGLMFTGRFQVGMVDYLGLGSVYYQLYNDSTELKDAISESSLASMVTLQRNITEKSLKLLQQSKPDDAVEVLTQSFSILQPFYFEILTEYLLRKMPVVQIQKTSVELDVSSAKDLLFSLNPNLKDGFSLKRITCLPSNVDTSLKDRTKGSFSRYLELRLPQYIERYLGSKEDWYGHTLFRQFDKRIVFEQLVASKLWEEANRKKVSVVTYRVPKGEVAILPTKELNARLIRIEDRHIAVKLSANITIGTFHAVARKGTLRSPYT